MSAAALHVQGLDKHFGGLHVTRGVDLQLQAGERLALIGPNGAGKTTLVNLMSGVLAPSGGTIHLQGADVTRRSQAQRVRQGLARTYQITTLAMRLTVLQQVEMALHEREGVSRRMWRSTDRYPQLRDEAWTLIEGLHLSHAALRTPAELAYGEQRLVEIALALALRPKVLLLDEPMAGVPQREGATVLAALQRLPADLAVLLIEHDMDLVFRYAQRIVVLAEGAVLAAGTPDEIKRNEQVRAVYLGH
jgi:branched-chain amino acid transport system ATP-binding protein